MGRGILWAGAFGVLLGAARPAGQPAVPDDVKRERVEYAGWLATAPASPFRALGQYPIGRGITIGPAGADVPLAGLALFRLEEKGANLVLTIDGATRPVWRDRLVSLGGYQLLAQGPRGRTVATVFGSPSKSYSTPEHFPYSARWRIEAKLAPPVRALEQRLLAADGTEVEATAAGTVTASVAGRALTLRVFRIPSAGGEESELEIYFQDSTNGRGSYPAGRFVSLVPSANGTYILDFNRARNPFCAYNSVYPCPAPWRGNRLPIAVAAGERYAGGGLSRPPQ